MSPVIFEEDYNGTDNTGRRATIQFAFMYYIALIVDTSVYNTNQFNTTVKSKKGCLVVNIY